MRGDQWLFQRDKVEREFREFLALQFFVTLFLLDITLFLRYYLLTFGCVGLYELLFFLGI
jgi:hypothetical protein